MCLYRPRRSRRYTFTARDVGRIACYARGDGVTAAQLLEELQDCAPCPEPQDNRDARGLLSQAMAMAQQNAVQITLWVVAIAALAALSRFFVPAVLRLLPVAAGTVLSRVAATEVQMIARKAANDALFQRIAQFLARAA